MDYPSDPDVNLNGGKFTDGDSELSIPSSADPASWANSVTDELLNVIVAGGLVPDENSLDQVSAAIQLIIEDMLGALAALAQDSTDVDATATEINHGCDGIGVSIPRQKVVEIGDWDMDADGQHYVEHGLSVSTIIGVRGVIRNDGNVYRYVIADADAAGGSAGLELCFYRVDSTYVHMTRAAGGTFDSTNFDSTSFNRGWLIIDFLD